MENGVDYRADHKRHILITGLPGSGKTTLIIGLINKIPGTKCGFVTKEVRDEKVRIGFDIVTLPFGVDSKRVPLAAKPTAAMSKTALEDSPRIGSYRVFVENIEKIAVGSIAEGCDFTIIDEIGKMECISNRFKDAVLRSFELDGRVIATVPKRGVPFVSEIKSRRDVQIFEITRGNRNSLLDEILIEILKWDKVGDNRSSTFYI